MTQLKILLKTLKQLHPQTIPIGKKSQFEHGRRAGHAQVIQEVQNYIEAKEKDS